MGWQFSRRLLTDDGDIGFDSDGEVDGGDLTDGDMGDDEMLDGGGFNNFWGTDVSDLGDLFAAFVFERG